ncbi:DUF2948 family protein [Taklimakanibacter lacteus]|uniref:DUF2948 family protein n=1 Tax=Taklimakanibacter lacteus TaxID=2268456 RepID=UPI000E66DC57
MSLLKLTALDAADLEIISAHMQDAVITLGDIRFLKASGKFALIANRFIWQAQKPPYERRRTGLSFDRVLSARSQRIRQGADDAILSLLSISFTPDEEPSGTVVLTFSGGGAIHLKVECIEARLADLGPAWETPNQPSHDR